MALAPRLELKQSQQLVMTPQLQQAIKLLQLSNLELSDFVEQQLEENPFLERAAEEPDRASEAKTKNDNDPQGEQSSEELGLDLTRSENLAKAEDALDADFNEDSSAPPNSDSAPSSAGDTYQTNEWAGLGDRRNGFDDDRDVGEGSVSEISLREHLSEQLKVATSDAQHLFVGAYIIDLIDDAGYLQEQTDVIADRLGTDEKEIEACLQFVQTFDPVGVGARNLKECLCLQLAERDRLDPAMRAFIENLELLAKGDLKGLIKVTSADEEDVRDMIAEVRALNPKPGYAYGSDLVQVVAPDVYVLKSSDGGWKIELNNDTLPKILVNQHYYAEISKNSTAEKRFQLLSRTIFECKLASKKPRSACTDDSKSIKRDCSSAKTRFWRTA